MTDDEYVLSDTNFFKELLRRYRCADTAREEELYINFIHALYSPIIERGSE
jgi:hypothetical protein